MGAHLARGRKPVLWNALNGFEASRRAKRRRRDYVPRPSERKRRSRSCVGSKIAKKTEGFLGLLDIFIVKEITVPARAKVSLPTELQRASS